MEEYTTQRLTESSWDNKEWICSICGRKNEEEFKYCPECGEKKPDYKETQTEITIKKLKRKGFENCEQLFRLLIHVKDEEGNLLGSYNMTLHGYATKQELLNLLEDYLGYKEDYPAPYKEYHLEIQDWPYHSLDSVYGVKEDFHVCELYSNEWNVVRKEYSEREPDYEETWEEIRMKRKAYEQKYKKDIERPIESMYFLYGCPNSRDIEEKKEVETKIEIVYF